MIDRTVFADQTVDLIDDATFEKRAKLGKDKIKRLPIGSNFLADNPGHHTVLKTDDDVVGLLDDLSKAAPIILDGGNQLENKNIRHKLLER
ncbi:hypothetical protein LCGC14_1377060 [marine sediment metagenome]|uniref:Uncharacterized protein n=1 Tax=marine sediment metagenome TaxID=412755 RepID=A0A0F9MJ17_9ZZZZ|nr:hypothetical protein [Desulfobacterales bacterium]